MLENVINQRKIEALSYEEYLRNVVELAEAILHPERSMNYPDSVKNSEALRALFDFLDKNENLAVDIHDGVKRAIQPDWKRNFQKQQKIKLAIYEVLLVNSYSEDEATVKTDEVFDLIERQVEYDE